jgi:MoaA/NifB/PqqE/SkfB family radical SAM enzyme
VNLSGGEPTVRSDLPDIIELVKDSGLECAMTTNGIRLPGRVLEQLRNGNVKVKVSLHGPRQLHDEMLGVPCFDRVEQNIGRLLDANIQVAIQTVVTQRQPDVHGWAIRYCMDLGIGKLRLVPFVPRGRGMLTVDAYQLNPGQRAGLEEAIQEARRELGHRLDVDMLDFWTHDYFVIETDGELQVQRETDTSDSTVLGVDGTPITIT